MHDRRVRRADDIGRPNRWANADGSMEEAEKIWRSQTDGGGVGLATGNCMHDRGDPWADVTERPNRRANADGSMEEAEEI